MTRLPTFNFENLLMGSVPLAAGDFETAVQGTRLRLRQAGLAGQPVILLDTDRADYLVAFIAGLSLGCDILLPNSGIKAASEAVADFYPEVGVIARSPEPLSSILPTVVPVSPHDVVEEGRAEDLFALDFNPDQQVVVFTSGSTGRPEGHARPLWAYAHGVPYWNERLALGDGPVSIVATVPPQHMYGLEASIMLPLVRPKTRVLNRRPFLPQDVSHAVGSVPDQCLLVTTPLHLQSMLKSDQTMAGLDRIVSATAPLPEPVARAAEERWQVPVYEVYGSTETGMIATRRPAQNDLYQVRGDLTLTPLINDVGQEGDGVVIEGVALDTAVVISDRLELTGEGFRFQSRGNDLVNIAGKRASLSGLNRLLTNMPGVEDGVFLATGRLGGQGLKSERLIALVVAPDLTAKALKACLRGRMEEVFLPRRIFFLDRLPRNEIGKLPRQALDQLLDQLLPPQPPENEVQRD